jgi:hypothetical protein
VRRITMLISSEGRWVAEGSPEFLEMLGDPTPDYDSTQFAVKNLGFIKFDMIDHAVIEVELHPRNVELPALLAAQQQLLCSEIGLYRIRYLTTTWHSEITASRERAIARLSELCAPADCFLLSERFTAEALDASELFKEDATSLRPLAQKWRAAFGYFDSTVISLAIQHGLLAHMMIFALTPPDPDPVFRFVGNNLSWLGKDPQVNAIGRKITSQPDGEYGGWVSQFYKSVASSGQPRYDIVKAAIQPTQSISKPYLTRYERLLLPWRTSSKEVLVTVCSKKLGEPAASGSSSVLADSSFAKKVRMSS